MRVSKYFKLDRSQPTLDFVDVDVTNDTPLFISPRALLLLSSDWGNECVHLVQNFFETILSHIKAGNQSSAEALLRALREPNETHLGLSQGRSRGRALGSSSAHDVWGALSRSVAARSGLLKDLEDTVLMVEGISVDIVSDIATNIIRGPLIRYTQEMATQYGLPLQEGVASGPLWDSGSRSWSTGFTHLPMTTSGKLLLVPKAIVRHHLEYDTEEYYRHYLLEHLRQVELDANSGLVELLKNKNRRVTKKKLIEKYGAGKTTIVRETLKYPEVLEKYRKAKRDKPHLALQHEEIAEVEGADARPDWDDLLNTVKAVVHGPNEASQYERAVEALLSALFYPVLVFPNVQHEIHDGRKRIDITYTNMATEGFFQWLATHYTAPLIFVECKNYGREVGNPELDQISGRFSRSRGQVGILVCRSFVDKEKFLQRCRDTASDGRGYVIALDDDDLATLVNVRRSEPTFSAWSALRERFLMLVS